MNVETGEVKPLADLTDAERESGKWVKATPAALRDFDIRRRQRAARREHNRQVRREEEAMARPAVVASRKTKAEAKRTRKRERNLVA